MTKQQDTIMKPVNSTTIRRIGYVETTATLIIDFPSGTYVFDGVPFDLHDKFMQADSPGKFFGTYIRGKYPATRLPDPIPGENKNPAHALAVTA
jgi:hypothetical protein